jgi:hypothetical protein
MAVSLDTPALVAATSLHREWGSLDMERRGTEATLHGKHRRSVLIDMRGNAGNSWLLRRPHTKAVRERRGSWTGRIQFDGGTLITIQLSRRVSAKMRKCSRYGGCDLGSRQSLYTQITTTSSKHITFTNHNRLRDAG